MKIHAKGNARDAYTWHSVPFDIVISIGSLDAAVSWLKGHYGSSVFIASLEVVEDD